MYDVLSPVRSLLKIDDISIDNAVFKLHYKVTVIILLACSLLIAQKQYFGDPIDCMTSSDKDQELVDTYCWILSTYIYDDGSDSNKFFAGVSMPIGLTAKYGQKAEKKYHSYYQWVTLFLYLQAMTFYLPRYIWKIWEGSRIKMLVSDLHFPIVEEENKRERIQFLLSYLKRNNDDFGAYVIKYTICEILNFANVILQIHLTDWFIGSTFMNYGREAYSYMKEDSHGTNYAMEKAFPKRTKCNFMTYGPSGTPQVKDALCVLPLNIFNEKIFIVLWIWYILLAILSTVALIYRFVTVTSRLFRRILLSCRTRICNPKDIHVIDRDLWWGEWFFLYQIAKNMDPLIFKKLASELAKQKMDDENIPLSIIEKTGPEVNSGLYSIQDRSNFDGFG